MTDIIYQKKEKIKNKARVFNYITNKINFTKQEISKELNISFPTVTKILDMFFENNIIFENGFSEKNTKRKAILYKYNPNAFYSIGIKLELNCISFVIINLSGEEIKKTVIQKDFLNKDDFVLYIIKELDYFVDGFAFRKDIRGIGISLPGIVNDENKVFEIGTNFNLYAKSMKKIEKYFNLPVTLMNEANAGVIGEYILNKDNSKKNIVFISIDTGVGAGIIIDGVLYEGSTFKAGEFGHTTVEINGRKCNCGNHGCLERYCANPAFIGEFSEAFDIANLEYDEIFSKKLHETLEGKEIINKYVDYLASSIRGLLLLLDLDEIIIGGVISKYSHVFEKQLKEKVFNNIFYKNSEILKFSKSIDNSNLIGAALLPLKDIFLF